MPEDIERWSAESDEEQTQVYIRTNGPDEREFQPNIPPELLVGKSKSEKWLYEQADMSIKQNNWLIRQVVGLKGAIRVQQRRTEQVRTELQLELATATRRFQTIEAKLEPLAALWNKWLTRKKVMTHIILGLFSLFFLPFLALFMVEVLKHWLGWK
jgi:hypothetical protein